MINIYCKCGEIYHADEQHIGRKIICNRCGQIIVIKSQDNISNESDIQPISKKSENNSYSFKSSTRKNKSMDFINNKFIKGLFNKSWKIISVFVLLIVGIIIISNLNNNPDSFDSKNTIPNNQQESNQQSSNPYQPELENNYDNIQTPLPEEYDVEPLRPFKPIRALDYICIYPVREQMETDVEFQKRIEKYKFYKNENKKNAIAYNNSYKKYKIDSAAWAIEHKKWRDKHPNWKSITRYDDLKSNYSTTNSKNPTSSNNNFEPQNPNILPLGAAPFSYNIRGGQSTLTVDNGTKLDALIRVIRINNGNQNIRDFFIPTGKKFTATELPSGEYVIKIAYGKDWNSTSRKFNYHQSFSESESFEVTEKTWNESVEDGYIEHTQASDMFITLHKVPYGNFKTYTISEEEFWR